GAWAGYSAFGATRESVEQTFRSQYAAHPQLTLVLSEAGYHFLMWDDPDLVQTQILQFLQLAAE
ncbi:MAG: alpha/beta hydrolase, partial [Xanthomonadales bacterium]|nr:alpha/beta hydrolase [Xanthomonadales bacterium]